MEMYSTEAQFRNFLVEKLSLNRNKVRRQAGETPVHVRFWRDCGLTSFQDLLDKLSDLNLKYKPAPYKHFSRTPDYADQGIIVEWNNTTVGIQFNVPKDGRMSRKEFTPDALGLNGCTFNTPQELKLAVKKGLGDHKLSVCLLSMLDNISDSNKPIINLSDIDKKDIGRITSDYGEIIGAYSYLLKKQSVYFPKGSNHKIADFYANKKAVSAKGRKAGGKVNLSSWAEFISQDTITGKFLYSIATHNRNDFVKYAAMLCPEVNNIVKMAGGSTREDLKNLVNTMSYDEFYNYIGSTPSHKGLGVPSGQTSILKSLWESGDLNPIDFTINTLVNRLWGENATKEISNVVCDFLHGPVFIMIDIKDNSCIINELEFSDVKDWKTVYWSRATKAWHNWISVEPVNGV